jgi:hemerythrin-like metal-binding protein
MTQQNGHQVIIWDESMATGIPSIDAEHQHLFDILHEANLQENSGDQSHLKEVIKHMMAYAIVHFETEETLMKQYAYQSAYPQEAREHIAQHRKFSSKVVAINEQLREGQKVSQVKILDFLNNWLSNHVLGIDQLLGNYLIHEMHQFKKLNSD